MLVGLIISEFRDGSGGGGIGFNRLDLVAHNLYILVSTGI